VCARTHGRLCGSGSARVEREQLQRDGGRGVDVDRREIVLLRCEVCRVVRHGVLVAATA